MEEAPSIILGVTGSVAAFKAVLLYRILTKEGDEVKVIMTKRATDFIGPLTFAGLSGRDPYLNFSIPGHPSLHLELAKQAKSLAIYPASANTIAKLASGACDDLLSAIVLSAKCPVLIFPAMHAEMYGSKQVTRNLEVLKSLGLHVIEPDSGDLGSGDIGPGRLVEPQIAHFYIKRSTRVSEKFKNKKVLITGGPTFEAIDPVRGITNRSSGIQSLSLALEAFYRGSEVTFVTSKPFELPREINQIIVEAASEMSEMVQKYGSVQDIMIFCAAVSDYKPLETALTKLKRESQNLTLDLEKNVDVLGSAVSRFAGEGKFFVGFAAETNDIEKYAKDKLEKKNLDMIVANNVAKPAGVFGSESNSVIIMTRKGCRQETSLLTKSECAEIIFDCIEKEME